MSGKLYLIPTTLGENGTHTIPTYVVQQIHQIEVFIVERGKTARKYLKEVQTPIPLQQMLFFELNKRTDASELKSFLQPAIEEGKDIGLISEAGCPGVADPGADIVLLAHQLGLEVVPMVGPSSILLALMSSGMNGQKFAFHGYLPVKPNDRKKALQNMERESQRQHQTQVFIETPYRNDAFVEDVLKVLQPKTLFGIACDLTLPSQYICTLSIAEWRKKKDIPKLHKRPTIFLILA